LAVGIPPHLALGTNKLQSSFGSLTATIRFARQGLVRTESLLAGILITFVSACLGTICIQHMSSDILKLIMPLMLAGVFLFLIFAPRFGLEDQKPRLGALGFYALFGTLIGFYDGFFGPGTGTFWALSLAFFLGMNLKTATANTKVLNNTSNVASLLFFLLGHQVLFGLGLLMAVGQVLGAMVGARLVIRHGAHFVKIIFLFVVGGTLCKVVWSTFFAAR
ncbi:MAG: hypothetical protein ACD_62C00600G0008, partial [uncultured bacterium]